MSTMRCSNATEKRRKTTGSSAFESREVGQYCQATRCTKSFDTIPISHLKFINFGVHAHFASPSSESSVTSHRLLEFPAQFPIYHTTQRECVATINSTYTMYYCPTRCWKKCDGKHVQTVYLRTFVVSSTNGRRRSSKMRRKPICIYLGASVMYDRQRASPRANYYEIRESLVQPAHSLHYNGTTCRIKFIISYWTCVRPSWPNHARIKDRIYYIENYKGCCCKHSGRRTYCRHVFFFAHVNS